MRTCVYCHLVAPRCLDLRSDLLPCLLQSSRFRDLHQPLSCSHRPFSVITVHTKDCRTAWGLMTWTGCLRTGRSSHLGTSSELRRPHCNFWSFLAARCRLRSAITATLRPRLPPLSLTRLRESGLGESMAPLPKPQRFLLHAVTSASSALSRWEYYP